MIDSPIFDWKQETSKTVFKNGDYVSIVEKTRRKFGRFKRKVTRFVVAEYRQSVVTCGWGANTRKENAFFEKNPKAYSNMRDALKDLAKRIQKRS
jgi:hypothetical protein